MQIQCFAQDAETKFWADVQKVMRVTTRLATLFVCLRCRLEMERTVDSIEKLRDEVKTVNGFCYLGDRLKARGG